jgi:hypothetical protein
MAVITPILAAVALIAGTLILLLYIFDAVLTANERLALTRKVEDFWFSTDQLDAIERMKEALQLRYATMQRSRIYFFRFFWLVCCVVAFGTIVHEFFYSKTSEVISTYKSAAALNIKLKWDFWFGWAYRNISDIHYFTVRPSDCFGDASEDWYARLRDLYLLGERYTRLFDQLGVHHALPLRAATAVATFLEAAEVSFIASGALFMSFRITLWLLSRATSSTLKLTLMVFGTIIIAVVMPPLIISTVMQIFWLTTVFATGGIVDFTSFSNPNWFTITLVSNYLLFGFTQPLAVAYAQLTYLLPTAGKFIAFYFFGWPIVIMTYNRTIGFFSEVWKALHLDFTGVLGDAVVNWAIVTDLLFSLSYLLPAFALVALHRNLRARTTVLTFLAYLSEHPRGVLIAMTDGIKAPFRWTRQ